MFSTQPAGDMLIFGYLDQSTQRISLEDGQSISMDAEVEALYPSLRDGCLAL